MRSYVPENASHHQPTVETVETIRSDMMINVRNDEGQIEEMDLDTYLVSVVLGEMPADFATEALKAQAVVARTYTLKRATGNLKHPDAAVCTSFACCQAYRTPEEFLASGGTKEQLDKVKNAVDSTGGMVLYYCGELIDATYFSSSGGRTEDAAAVWGADIPYLRSVESPGEEVFVELTHSVEMNIEEFSSKLGLDRAEFSIGKTQYTAGGGVEKIEIGGKEFSGVQFRQILGLKSTAFSLERCGNTVVITTKGFGHRVGMSQYGAEAMAVGGSNFREILSHYYPGTNIGVYLGD